MKLPHRRSTLIALASAVPAALLGRATAAPAGPPPRGSATDGFPQNEAPDVKLPNGKSQRDEILKADHEQNLKDSAELAALAEELQRDIEKNDAFVFSLATLKKTDDIEKLVKKIRARLRRY